VTPGLLLRRYAKHGSPNQLYGGAICVQRQRSDFLRTVESSLNIGLRLFVWLGCSKLPLLYVVQELSQLLKQLAEASRIFLLLDAGTDAIHLHSFFACHTLSGK
jgi:hypothetical protein